MAFGKKRQRLHVHRQLAGARAEQIAGDADVVAQVEQLVEREALLAHRVQPHINLQPLALLLQRGKAGLALRADGHDAPGDRDRDAVRLKLFAGRLVPLARAPPAMRVRGQGTGWDTRPAPASRSLSAFPGADRRDSAQTPNRTRCLPSLTNSLNVRSNRQYSGCMRVSCAHRVPAALVVYNHDGAVPSIPFRRQKQPGGMSSGLVRRLVQAEKMIQMPCCCRRRHSSAGWPATGSIAGCTRLGSRWPASSLASSPGWSTRSAWRCLYGADPSNGNQDGNGNGGKCGKNGKFRRGLMTDEPQSCADAHRRGLEGLLSAPSATRLILGCLASLVLWIGLRLAQRRHAGHGRGDLAPPASWSGGGWCASSTPKWTRSRRPAARSLQCCSFCCGCRSSPGPFMLA